MSVGLLIVAHGSLGEALVETACGTLGHCPLATELLSVPRDCNPEEMCAEAHQLCAKLDSGEGVLVLTDLFGSTPSNVACSLMHGGSERVRVVSGINLPMLIRVFNYPTLDLDTLTAKALSAGCEGVFLVGGQNGEQDAR